MFKQKLTWLTDKTYSELFLPLSILWFKKLRDKIVYHKKFNELRWVPSLDNIIYNSKYSDNIDHS